MMVTMMAIVYQAPSTAQALSEVLCVRQWFPSLAASETHLGVKKTKMSWGPTP